MNKKPIKILAIESSCDETAATVIGVENDKPVILSNIISSQIDLHAKTGGVVPEVASRAHMESIIPVVTEALLAQNTKNYKLKTKNYQKAIASLSDITHIAVTSGPGLIGSLLVGFNAAKTLAYSLDLPVIPINHIEGHIYSAIGGVIDHLSLPITHLNEEMKNVQINEKCEMRNEKFPILALTVSGGHTSLTLMHDHGKYETIGQTVDDAVGEAYDKVARLLNLGYPGGPAVSKLASKFRDIDHLSLPITHLNEEMKNVQINEKCKMRNDKSRLKIAFPRPMINDGTFNFSFSGLKTAVLQRVLNIQKSNGELSEMDKEEICAAFEEAVAEVLATKTAKAVLKYCPKAVIFAGGVSANGYLADKIELGIRNYELGRNSGTKIQFLTPDKQLTGDNAAMIGLAAYYHILRGDISSWRDIKVDSNLEL